MNPGLQKELRPRPRYQSGLQPLTYDCFMLFNEVDMLECRLEHLDDVVDRFVIVESGETHQGWKKSSNFMEHKDRYRFFWPKIDYIWAPTLSNTEPMLRDEEQRTWFRHAFGFAHPWDIVMQSDIDELPTPEFVADLDLFLWGHAARTPLVSFEMDFYCFAVDWKHPRPWYGTIAGRLAHLPELPRMRHMRCEVPFLGGGGKHLSWIGGPKVQSVKVDAFAHSEIGPQRWDIANGKHYRTGMHVDGQELLAVEVDDGYPNYIRERRCPDTWFRPR